MEIMSIWIGAEEGAGEWTSDDASSDVEVVLSDRSRWRGSFVTYRNIASLCAKNAQTGTCLSGSYFWASDLLLVDVLSRQRVEEVVRDLIHEGQLPKAFSLLGFDDAGDEFTGEVTMDMGRPNDIEDGQKATAQLGGKTVRRVVKRGPNELMVEFADGTRLFLNSTPSDIELAIT
jgi:hypothetical protein